MPQAKARLWWSRPAGAPEPCAPWQEGPAVAPTPHTALSLRGEPPALLSRALLSSEHRRSRAGGSRLPQGPQRRAARPEAAVAGQARPRRAGLPRHHNPLGGAGGAEPCRTHSCGPRPPSPRRVSRPAAAAGCPATGSPWRPLRPAGPRQRHCVTGTRPRRAGHAYNHASHSDKPWRAG